MHSLYPGSKSQGLSKSLPAKNSPIKCDNANLLAMVSLSLYINQTTMKAEMTHLIKNMMFSSFYNY